jgi:hypothetical protein
MKRVLVGLSALLGVLLILIAGLLTAVRPGVDVPLEIAKGLITLAVAVAVTGVLSFLLGERNRELGEHEERVRVLTAARQDFKTAFEQVQVARFFLGVHPTAKTLHEQMSTLIGARAYLQRVQRERYIRDDQLVDDAIQDMLDYLRAISREYGANYRYITYERLAEEAEHKQLLEGQAIELKDRSLLPDHRFMMLAAFLSDDQFRSSDFAKGYRDVRRWLEKQLAI